MTDQPLGAFALKRTVAADPMAFDIAAQLRSVPGADEIDPVAVERSISSFILKAPVFFCNRSLLPYAKPNWDDAAELRQPFPHVLLEYQDGDMMENTLLILGTEFGPDRTLNLMFWTYDKVWGIPDLIPRMLEAEAPDYSPCIMPFGDKKPDPDENTSVFGSVYYAFLRAMAERPTLTRGLPQSARTLSPSQGKVGPKGWSYSVIDLPLLPPPAAASAALGGTHASPCWHLRRGHWRRYPNGKSTWIEATEVGDRSQGVAIHDYRLQGGAP